MSDLIDWNNYKFSSAEKQFSIAEVANFKTTLKVIL